MSVQNESRVGFIISMLYNKMAPSVLPDKLPMRYLPAALSKQDKLRQLQMLKKSRKQYRTGKYYTRKQLPSFRNKESAHIVKARRIYGVDSITPNPALAKATGCSIAALKKIVRKGEGAYFSSGSRPNQTAHSWGYARLASSITAGKSAAVDYGILEQGCNHNKRAFRLAEKSRRKYGRGRSHARRIYTNTITSSSRKADRGTM